MANQIIGKKLDSEYEPGPDDWRITLKVFGDQEEELRMLAFVGDAQVSPEEDRYLAADELTEDMGKDVTSCVDFNGDYIYHQTVNIVFMTHNDCKSIFRRFDMKCE